MELCEFIARHPTRVRFRQPEAILRHAIRKYADEVGKLWIYLADYHARLEEFDKAREAFEEALESISTARDFGVIYNAYLKFEEQMVDIQEEGGGISVESLVNLTMK